MTAHRPSVNALVLKRNIPIVVRDSTDQFMPNVLLPIGQPFVFLLSFQLVFGLVVGTCLLTSSHYLTVKSFQPLGRWDLKFDFDAVAESQLCVAAKVNSDHGIWNNLQFPVLVGRDVDVVVLASTNQSGTSNVCLGRDLLQAVDPQPTFQSLYPDSIPLDEEGLVVLN